MIWENVVKKYVKILKRKRAQERQESNRENTGSGTILRSCLPEKKRKGNKKRFSFSLRNKCLMLFRQIRLSKKTISLRAFLSFSSIYLIRIVNNYI